MKHLKKLLFACVYILSLNTNAQDNKVLSNAFAVSYDYEAIKNYDYAINSILNVYSANSYEINLRLGWLYSQAINYKESIVYYQKAMALMPAATEPKWGIINPYSKLENWNEVEKIYNAILKLDPKNATANYKLGLIHFYNKDYINAKKYFDVTLNLNPFGYNYMLMTAWTYYYLGNKNEALILFNKTLLYSPKDKSALEGLSLIK
jgi:tetratricopeptide (TPR) repeat protein